MMITRIKIYIKSCYHKQKLAPFETMFGFICIYGGLAGLFNFGIINNIFNDLLSKELLIILNTIYLLAGITIFLGIITGKGNIEAFGLTILATTLVIRVLLFGWLLGFNPIIVNAYVSNAAFVFACIVRMRTIVCNSRIIQIHKDNAKFLLL